MASGLTAFTSSGVISGSGLAMAKMIGALAMLFTISCVTAPLAETPIIFAMANPDPEITPEEVKAVRPDAIVATGRSDYPNQVNNVLGFPYIFRGALDVR